MTSSNRRLDKYEIIEELGRGGFATVYKAKETSLLGRLVAIKVLHPSLLNDVTFVRRFQREAEIMSQLFHPNIAMILDVGEADGQLYMAMQYIPGTNLRQYVIKHGQLTMDQIASIVQQIGAALDYAHAHNAIHRDVKPSNIIYGDDGHATLTDFGIARVTDATTVLSSLGGVVGTPHYTSPEQAESKPVDGRSDIYSLGVTAYEMCTGKVPYEADSTPSLYYKIVHEPPQAPSVLNARVAAPIEQVLLKAMAKKPEDRYQTGVEFATAFSAAVKETQGNFIKSLLSQAKDDLANNAYDAAETKLQQAIAIDSTHNEARELIVAAVKRREWTRQYLEITASVAELRKRAEQLKKIDDGMADTQGVIKLLTKGIEQAPTLPKTTALTGIAPKREQVLSKVIGQIWVGMCVALLIACVVMVSSMYSGQPREFYIPEEYVRMVNQSESYNLVVGIGVGIAIISGGQVLVSALKLLIRNAKPTD